MKYKTRAKIAIAGVGLVCATALFGSVYKIVESYKPAKIAPHPVRYVIKCEPIDTTKIENQQTDDVVIMDTVVTEIESGPQIEEQESESTFV